MRETEIIERIRKRASVGPLSLIRGIGDDCAVLRPDADSDLVFTTDFVLEGRHFTRAMRPEDIGNKALARSLSDLAAMGAEPLFCLVSLAVPEDSEWIDRFYSGLLSVAERFNIALAGGDLSRFEHVVADVMCCGSVPRGSAIQRSGAKPGDALYVTGPLGAAAASGWTRLPEPRIEEGIRLRGIATSGMDLSDGLSSDLARLCAESGVGAEIEGALIPVAAGATRAQALHGGEDYELLFTASQEPPIPSYRIGVITAERAVRIDGELLQPEGFDHFGRSFGEG